MIAAGHFSYFFNISFLLANLCDSSLSLNSVLPGSLCPGALWYLGLQCLQIFLYLSYWDACPICPCWSRSSWQMGPGYCGKSQALKNAERLPFSCLFPSVVPLRLLAALPSLKNTITIRQNRVFFCELPAPFVTAITRSLGLWHWKWLHWKCWGCNSRCATGALSMHESSPAYM